MMLQPGLLVNQRRRTNHDAKHEAITNFHSSNLAGESIESEAI